MCPDWCILTLIADSMTQQSMNHPISSTQTLQVPCVVSYSTAMHALLPSTRIKVSIILNNATCLPCINNVIVSVDVSYSFNSAYESTTISLLTKNFHPSLQREHKFTSIVEYKSTEPDTQFSIRAIQLYRVAVYLSLVSVWIEIILKLCVLNNGGIGVLNVFNNSAFHLTCIQCILLSKHAAFNTIISDTSNSTCSLEDAACVI